MNTILVTGAGGFVGRHVLSRAADRSLEAVASRGDLRDADAVRTLFARVRPDAVIHLASGLKRTVVAGDEVRMAVNVLAAARGAMVLIAGSAAQYGMAQERPLAEDAPTEPLTPYGAAKCAVERAALAAPGAHVVFARAFNIVGPGQPSEAPIPSWAAQLAAGVRTLRTGDLDVVRDFIDVRDMADAFLDLVECGFVGVVNVGSGVPVKLRAVVEELVLQSGTGATVEADPALRRAQDPPYVVADTALLRRLTGFATHHTLRESLADVWAEWRPRYTASAR
jgi:GDP-4-dehydro-6-deoxy-D-mannose reductase